MNVSRPTYEELSARLEEAREQLDRLHTTAETRHGAPPAEFSGAALPRGVFDALRDATLVLDRDGRVRSVNRAAMEVLRTPEADLVGRRVVDIVSSGAGPDIPGSMDAPTRVPWAFEGRAFEVTRDPTLDAEGALTGAICTAVDITAAETTARSLAESHERFRSTLDTILEGCQIIGFDWTYLYLNEAAEVQNRRPNSELLGRKMMEMWPGIEASPVFALLRRSMEERVEVREVIEFQFPDGESGWYDVRSAPLPEGILVMHLDVTERTHFEERLTAEQEKLRFAMEGASVGVWDWSIPADELTCSETWRTTLGYGPDDPPTRQGLFEDLIHADDLPAAKLALQRHLDDSDQDFDIEFRMRHGDGEYRWVNSRGRVLLRDSHGEPLRMIGVHIDIDAQRAAEREAALVEAAARHQQKLESIGTLAAGVAHEINNPINGVLNYAQLILDAPENPASNQECAREIISETERVATIVRDLLAFSRNDKQAHSPAAIEDIIGSTLSLVRTIIRRDQITLKVDIAPGLPRLKCRSQQIQQVLMNLLTNARDALNQRFPGHHVDKVLAISAALFERGGRRWIRVKVSDRGVGIEPALLGRIFDPFFTTKGRDAGTGLGLSIAHGIVADHHGTIEVESRQGVSTTVRVELPVDNGWSLTEGRTVT